MDGQKKYASYMIPRQETSSKKDSFPSGGEGAVGAAELPGAEFAEIEMDFDSGRVSAAEKALRFFSSVTLPEPIEQRTFDPLRIKFYEMRRLASDRPFARDDSELFYKQAKFMEDFTDDFPGEAKFFMYYPFYQHMGYEQLRTYFTWRTKARNGDLQPISGSYVFVYVYELLNNIGVKEPEEGLDKLTGIWNNCLKLAPAIGNYMPQWLKDYHIYYDLQRSFTDFAKELGLIGYYPMNFLFDPDAGNSFELWNSISGYGVSMSKFYKDGNEQLYKDCLFAVIGGIRELCAKNNIGIEDLFIYRKGNNMPWHPFKNALFHNWMRQSDRKAELPGHERYYCKNSRWSVNLPIYYSTKKDFAGYIMKKTEACLRQVVKYKYKLTAEPGNRYNTPLNELKKLEGAQAALDGAIEKAVADFHRDMTRTVVTVDHENLARIRKESLGTQEKLIVPEEAAAETAIWNEGINIRDEESEIAEGGDAGWQDFKKALSPTELEALSIILHGGAGIKAFADENGIMLEVLADSINEKASDIIGDGILETDGAVAIYDEYWDKVAEVVKIS